MVLLQDIQTGQPVAADNCILNFKASPFERSFIINPYRDDTG